MTERDLFLSALDLPAADRPAYLARACAGDADLRRKVDGLLAALAAAGSFLENPNPDPVGRAVLNPSPLEGEGGTARPRAVTGEGNETHDLPVTSDLPAADPDRTSLHVPTPDSGTVIGGRYKLIEPIGEGGMGAVWMAQQTEPVKRPVAVKLIKAGMDSRAVLARFGAERQALALMDHPNIARVFDAGATPDGRPYFVMELVKGVPITQFCDARKLTPRQRLELFQQVCQAVQHAHQKGVIHRDIKPSNVLVALYDDLPVPKVIDFGVAKAAGQPLTDKTLMTGFGAVVGTPEYMSPEQASFNQLDVDTRSDVYSLGVLLYELLAGSPPFERADLERAGLLEVLRVIREQEPPRPSARLSTSAALASLAAVRGTDPGRLAALVRGELDWIVMRALEKDRTRRYDTAAGFAADVGRYLVGEPVLAVPPSVGYRVRTFVRRNRAAVLVAAGFVLLTWAAATGIYFAYRRAAAAEADARASAQEANDERQKADAARVAVEAGAERERASGRRAHKAVGELANQLFLRNRVRREVTEWSHVTGLPETIEELPVSEQPLLDSLLQYYQTFSDYLGETREDLLSRAECYSRIGTIRKVFADHSAAATAYGSALQFYERAVGANPSERADRQGLRDSLVAVAEALNRAGRHEEAMAHWGRAATLSPGRDEDFLLLRARGLAWAGRVTDAVRAIDELTDGGRSDHYNAACVISLASATCRDDPARREALARRAVQAIRAMLATEGYPHGSTMALASLKFDPDLNPLRDRPDFQRVLVEAEDKYRRAMDYPWLAPPPREVRR